MDPEDPAVVAEAELLGAAAKIESAARKLESLKARPKHSKVIKLIVIASCYCFLLLLLVIAIGFLIDLLKSYFNLFGIYQIVFDKKLLLIIS